LGYFPTVFGVIVLIGIAVFFWRREGPGSGRAYGNRIAAHIGIPRNVFWALLENGVKGSSRELLASLQEDRATMNIASAQVAPWLMRGIERLEARFGTQEMYEQAKPLIAGVLAAAEGKAQEAGSDVSSDA
jgi:malate synthase